MSKGSVFPEFFSVPSDTVWIEIFEILLELDFLMKCSLRIFDEIFDFRSDFLKNFEFKCLF